MNKQAHILVVDDDPEIRQLLGDYLESSGFRASTVGSGRDARAVLAREAVDLVVLDLMLPNESGLDICKALRADGDLPVIMLTALGDEVDRIVGLEVGADDYLAKPFNPRELVGRIRAVLRRSGGARRPASRYRFAGRELDTVARSLTGPAGESVALGGADFQLLTLLLSAAPRVLSRPELLESINGREYDPLDRTIDVRVSRLRQLLGDDGRSPTLIRTVYGKGYTMGVAVERA